MSDVSGVMGGAGDELQRNRELLREVAQTGRIANFRTGEAVDELTDAERNGFLVDKPTKTIDAASIREALTGILRDAKFGTEPMLPGGIAASVRLFGVTITDTLDLNDATAIGGYEMPRLEFVKCFFEGRHVRFERCRVRSLSLRGCRLAELQASEAVIGGSVDLSYMRSSVPLMPQIAKKPLVEEGATKVAEGAALDSVNCCVEAGNASNVNPEEPNLCWVVLAGARIGGRINAGHSRFVAPKARDIDKWVLDSRHSIYALDLRGTRIQGSLNLRPDMSADGGVCLTLSKIEGSVWANGAKLIAREEWSFAADYADIRGSLYFRPYDGPILPGDEKMGMPAKDRAVFYSKGCMSLFAAKIGGSVYFEGAKLEAKDLKSRKAHWKDKAVVNLSTSVINGHCIFSSWISEPADPDEFGFASNSEISHFIGDGDVMLGATVIRNRLSLNGARVHAVYASNVEVQGNFDMGTYWSDKVRNAYPFVAWYGVVVAGGKVRGNFCMDGARVGSVEGDAGMLGYIDRTLPLVDGQRRVLSYADRTDRERVVLGGTIVNDGTTKEMGIFARGLNVGGDCSMEAFGHKGGVFQFECVGGISMEDAKISNSLQMSGARVMAYKDKTAVDLSGTVIGGKANFRTFKDEESNQGFVFEAWGGETGVKLTGAKITLGFNMNGAEVSGMRCSVEADNLEVGGNASFGTYEIRGESDHKLFSFTSHGKVSLISAIIRQKMDFSGARLHGSSWEGSENSGVGDALDLTLTATKELRLSVYPCRTKKHLFHATNKVILKHATIGTDLIIEDCIFEHQLDASLAKVSGSVYLAGIKMLWKDGGMGGSDEARQHYVQRSMQPTILLNGMTVGGFLKVWNSSKTEKDPSYRRLRPSGDVLTIAIDLRGATIGELDDFGGEAWGRYVRLWLEGFRYTRLKEADVTPLQATGPFRLSRIRDPSYVKDAYVDLASNTARGSKESDRWKHRALWLRLQYFDAKRPLDNSEFNPDAYEQAVAKMKACGSFEDAKRISSIQLTETNRVSSQLRRHIWRPFRIFFDYGFSVERAFVTVVLCLSLGLAGGFWARHKGVLWIDKTDHKACSKWDTGVYVFERFVPILDFKNQGDCTIDKEQSGWRLMQTGFLLLGWIVTPVSVLTASGLMKRHLER